MTIRIYGPTINTEYDMKVYKPMTILGYTTEYLDKTKCYLTWKGAKQLDACKGGLNFWKRKLVTSTGKPKKLLAKTVVTEFQHFCVACFVQLALGRLEDYNIILVDELIEFDNTLADQLDELCRCSITLPITYNDDQVQFLERILKAVIIISNKEKFGNEYKEEYMGEDKTGCGCSTGSNCPCYC